MIIPILKLFLIVFVVINGPLKWSFLTRGRISFGGFLCLPDPLQNWDALVRSVPRTSLSLLNPNDSLFSKVISINQHFLPKILLSRIIPPTPKHIKTLNSFLFKFLWNFSPLEPIKRSTLYLPKADGGIALPSIGLKISTAFLWQLIVLLQTPKPLHHFWMHFAIYNLGTKLIPFKPDLYSNTQPHRPKPNLHWKKALNLLRKTSIPSDHLSKLTFKSLYLFLLKPDPNSLPRTIDIPQTNGNNQARRHRLKDIHSRSDTNRTGAEGLSCYYPRLLHCLNQMLAVVLVSQHRVSSSKIDRPRAPCGARCIGHAVSTWSAVCSEAPHSQFGEGARPHLCTDEWNRPTPVRRRLSLTQAARGKPIPTGLAPVSGTKARSLEAFSQYSVFHLRFVHSEARMPSLARLSKKFRAPDTNGRLDLSLTWRVSEDPLKRPYKI